MSDLIAEFFNSLGETETDGEGHRQTETDKEREKERGDDAKGKKHPPLPSEFVCQHLRSCTQLHQPPPLPQHQRDSQSAGGREGGKEGGREGEGDGVF